MQLRSVGETSSHVLKNDDDVRVDELAAMVKAKLDQHGLNLRDAATQTGVSAATLSRVLNGKLPDTKTFAALVRWLGVSADLFIPTRSTASVPETIEAHLRADRTLPPELARALADLVRATYSSHVAAAAGGDDAEDINP